MPSTLEIEIGLTLAEYRAMSYEQLKEKSKELTPEQIQSFQALVRQDIEATTWKQRLEGTYPFDVEMREFILNEIVTQPISEFAIDCFGRLFEDYITTYPVNTNMCRPTSTCSLGAYGGLLDFELLERAIDEILEVAFDKFGFMLEWIQRWDYLTPTHSMISGTMRRKMPEYTEILNKENSKT